MQKQLFQAKTAPEKSKKPTKTKEKGTAAEEALRGEIGIMNQLITNIEMMQSEEAGQLEIFIAKTE